MKNKFLQGVPEDRIFGFGLDNQFLLWPWNWSLNLKWKKNWPLIFTLICCRKHLETWPLGQKLLYLFWSSPTYNNKYMLTLVLSGRTKVTWINPICPVKDSESEMATGLQSYKGSCSLPKLEKWATIGTNNLYEETK